jgi:hypothetical protein
MAGSQDARPHAVTTGLSANLVNVKDAEVNHGHWRDRHFVAGIISSSLAGIALGVVLGLIAPHDAVPRFVRTVRIVFGREHPRWEMLTQ